MDKFSNEHRKLVQKTLLEKEWSVGELHNYKITTSLQKSRPTYTYMVWYSIKFYSRADPLKLMDTTVRSISSNRSTLSTTYLNTTNGLWIDSWFNVPKVKKKKDVCSNLYFSSLPCNSMSSIEFCRKKSLTKKTQPHPINTSLLQSMGAIVMTYLKLTN